MHKKLLWAGCLWTVFVTVSSLSSAEAFEGTESWINIPHKDKYVHFIFYFVFSILWYFYFRLKRIKQLKTLIFLSSVGYGMLIEICQGLLTTNRNADILDMAANATGSAAAILLLLIIEKTKL